MHSFIALSLSLSLSLFLFLLLESRHLPPLRPPLFSTRRLAHHNFFSLLHSAQHEDKRVENYLFQVREEEEKERKKFDKKKKTATCKMLEGAEWKFVTRKIEVSSSSPSALALPVSFFVVRAPSSLTVTGTKHRTWRKREEKYYWFLYKCWNDSLSFQQWTLAHSQWWRRRKAIFTWGGKK